MPKQQITYLSERDQKALLIILNDKRSKPNSALVAAAKRYKHWFKRQGPQTD